MLHLSLLTIQRVLGTLAVHQSPSLPLFPEVHLGRLVQCPRTILASQFVLVDLPCDITAIICSYGLRTHQHYNAIMYLH